MCAELGAANCIHSCWRCRLFNADLRGRWKRWQQTWRREGSRRSCRQRRVMSSARPATAARVATAQAQAATAMEKAEAFERRAQRIEALYEQLAIVARRLPGQEG